MTELSQHTSQFAPLPVFSGHFRFAPLGAFYFWRIVVHTPVFYGADVSRFANFIFNRAPHQASWKFSASWAASFATRPPAPHDCPSPNFPFYCSHHGCFLFEPRRFSVRGCQTFTACVVWHLLFSNSRIIATRHSIRDRVFVSTHFPPSAPAGSVFYCSLIRRQFAASRSSIWAQFARLSDHRFPPACCTLIWRVPCQQFSWFKSFHYVILAIPILVGWFEDFFAHRRHIVQSRRFRISCSVVGSFFFFVGVPVRPIAR